MSAPQPGASPGHGAHGGQPGVSGGGRQPMSVPAVSAGVTRVTVS